VEKEKEEERDIYPRVPVVSALAPPGGSGRSNAVRAKNRETECTMKIMLIANSFWLIYLSYYQACTLHCMFTLSTSCSLLLSLLLSQPSKKKNINPFIREVRSKRGGGLVLETTTRLIKIVKMWSLLLEIDN